MKVREAVREDPKPCPRCGKPPEISQAGPYEWAGCCDISVYSSLYAENEWNENIDSVVDWDACWEHRRMLKECARLRKAIRTLKDLNDKSQLLVETISVMETGRDAIEKECTRLMKKAYKNGVYR